MRYLVKFIETESRITKGWGSVGGRNGKSSNGYRISVLQDEKGSGNGWWLRLHKKVNVLHATELYT